MKKATLFFAVLLFFNFSFSQQIKKVKIDDIVKMMDTSSVPLVVNFWASWCQPCIHEIPWFEKNVADFKNKKVKLILVSLDFQEDFPKKIESFAKKSGYTSQIVWLNESNADVFCPKIDKDWSGAIPVTVMINNAKNYKQFYGQQLPEERFKLELKKLVE